MPRPALRSARLLVSGSAGLPVPVFEQLAALAGQGPVERYGMTETLITVSGPRRRATATGRMGRPARCPGSRPVWSTRTACPVPPDGETVGELRGRGPPDETAISTSRKPPRPCTRRDGWIRTGDVACVDQAGGTASSGRQSTDLIKSGGYRVGAGEVEAALLAHPGGAGGGGGRACPTPIWARPSWPSWWPTACTGPELCDFVAGTLSVHKRPRRVELVDELPRNAMGKVQKKVLTCRRLLSGQVRVGILLFPGSVPEWPKGADCKSAGTAYGGSNPSRPTNANWLLTGGCAGPGWR